MHTPGPWRCVPTGDGEYYTHQIEITEGHIASIVGWSAHGAACPTTEANARLIEHAPDMASMLNDLLAWDRSMGGWDARCWDRARCVLDHATGSPEPHAPNPIASAEQIIEEAGQNEGWNDHTRLSLLLDFLNAEIIRNPILADRLQTHLRDATEI